MSAKPGAVSSLIPVGLEHLRGGDLQHSPSERAHVPSPLLSPSKISVRFSTGKDQTSTSRTASQERMERKEEALQDARESSVSASEEGAITLKHLSTAATTPHKGWPARFRRELELLKSVLAANNVTHSEAWTALRAARAQHPSPNSPAQDSSSLCDDKSSPSLLPPSSLRPAAPSSLRARFKHEGGDARGRKHGSPGWGSEEESMGTKEVHDLRVELAAALKSHGRLERELKTAARERIILVAQLREADKARRYAQHEGAETTELRLRCDAVEKARKQVAAKASAADKQVRLLRRELQAARAAAEEAQGVASHANATRHALRDARLQEGLGSQEALREGQAREALLRAEVGEAEEAMRSLRARLEAAEQRREEVEAALAAKEEEGEERVRRAAAGAEAVRGEAEAEAKRLQAQILALQRETSGAREKEGAAEAALARLSAQHKSALSLLAQAQGSFSGHQAAAVAYKARLQAVEEANRGLHASRQAAQAHTLLLQGRVAEAEAMRRQAVLDLKLAGEGMEGLRREAEQARQQAAKAHQVEGALREELLRTAALHREAERALAAERARGGEGESKSLGLQARVAALRQVTETLHAKLATTEHQVGALERRVASLERQREAVALELEEERAARAKDREGLREANAKAAAAEGRRGRVEEELERTRGERGAWKAKCQAAHLACRRSEEAAAAQRLRSADLLARMEKMGAEVRALEAQVQRAAGEREGKEEEMSRLRRRVEELQEENEGLAELEIVQERLAKAEQEGEELRERVEEAENARGRVEEEMAAWRVQHARAQEELVEVQERCAEAEGRADMLGQELRQSERRETEAGEREGRARREVEGLEASKAVLSAKLGDVEDHSRRLRTSLEQSQLAQKQAHQSVAKAREELEEARKGWEEERAKEREGLSGERDTLQAERAALQVETARLREQLAESRATITLLQAQSLSEREERERGEGELARERNSSSLLHARLHVLHREVASAEAVTEQQWALLQAAKTQLEGATEARHQLEQHLETLLRPPPPHRTTTTAQGGGEGGERWRVLEGEVEELREERRGLQEKLRAQMVDLCRLRTTLASSQPLLSGVF